MNTDNKWSLSNAYGNIQNLKETGSINLYICNSKAHLVKSGVYVPPTIVFVHARFRIISAFKQTYLLFLKKLKRQLHLPTRRHVRRGDMYLQLWIPKEL